MDREDFLNEIEEETLPSDRSCEIDVTFKKRRIETPHSTIYADLFAWMNGEEGSSKYTCGACGAVDWEERKIIYDHGDYSYIATFCGNCDRMLADSEHNITAVNEKIAAGVWHS